MTSNPALAVEQVDELAEQLHRVGTDDRYSNEFFGNFVRARLAAILSRLEATARQHDNADLIARLKDSAPKLLQIAQNVQISINIIRGTNEPIPTRFDASELMLEAADALQAMTASPREVDEIVAWLEASKQIQHQAGTHDGGDLIASIIASIKRGDHKQPTALTNGEGQ